MVGMLRILLMESLALCTTATVVCSQDHGGEANPSTKVASAAADSVTPEQRDQLQTYRAIISQGDAQSRRLMAEGLLELDFDARFELVIDLLRLTDGVDAAIAVCHAIASKGSTDPHVLSDSLVDPLIALLENENDVLSTSAADALGVFRSVDVLRRLGAVATDPDRPIHQRLAAIDVLSDHINRFEAVDELIGLAGSLDVRIKSRVLAAIRRASRTDFGDDAARWRQWWEEKKSLDKAAWLEDRLDFSLQQNAALEQLLEEKMKEEADRDREVFARFNQDLRSLFSLTSQSSQRDALIVDWLGDKLVAARLAALGLIREHIGEGDTPTEPVRSAVRACLSHGSRDVRIAALEIIGNLKDSADAPVLIELMKTETDDLVRETALRVLGRLENREAIPLLVAELDDPLASLGRVREAARAIGVIAAHGDAEDASDIRSAVEPLKRRFAQAPADGLRLREALLDAMASIGDPAFMDEFAANVTSASPELVLPAIRGIESTKNTQYLSQLIGHLDFPDARVRLLAADAIGTLGSEPGHLEALYRRFDADMEANDGVREAAWRAFQRVLTKIPRVREQWVERIERLPYLEDLISQWSQQNEVTTEIIAARDKVARKLMADGRPTDAMVHLRLLRRDQVTTSDPRAHETGIRLLRAGLAAGKQSGIVDTIVEIASDARSRQQRAEIEDAIVEFIAAGMKTDAVSTGAVIDQLRSIPDGTLTAEWAEKLERAIVATSEQPAPPTPPNP
jgi:HEAT repeat protein